MHLLHLDCGIRAGSSTAGCKARDFRTHQGLATTCVLLQFPSCALVISAGYEARDFSKHEGLANDMGLFLQKTNIIRDYLVRIWLVGAHTCCTFQCCDLAARQGRQRFLQRTQHQARLPGALRCASGCWCLACSPSGSAAVLCLLSQHAMQTQHGAVMVGWADSPLQGT